jgi:hypothetical protein
LREVVERIGQKGAQHVVHTAKAETRTVEGARGFADGKTGGRISCARVDLVTRWARGQHELSSKPGVARQRAFFVN